MIFDQTKGAVTPVLGQQVGHEKKLNTIIM
jgi:hypothetical protein